MPTYLRTQDALNVSVSCFKNYDTPSNPVTINLLIWLRSEKHRPKVESLRGIEDKTQRNSIKATLPAITPSGVFTYRKESNLVQGSHTRLIQFDIDLADNRNIRNYADLKAQIGKLPFVAYCALSASGKGYWGLVPIAYPERHSQHFDALKRVFAHYGIFIDTKPRNVASLRGYSYDPSPYQPESVMLFELYDEPTQPKPRPASSGSAPQGRYNEPDEAELLNRLILFAQAAREGRRHETLLKASMVAGGYIATGRMDEQTAVYGLETVASEWPMFGKSQETIRDGIRYGMTKPINAESSNEPISHSLQQPEKFKTILPTAKPHIEVLAIGSIETLPATEPPRWIHDGELIYGEALTNSTDAQQPPVNETSKENFFEWQRNNPPFNQLGISTL